jgi:hypothetical protein
MHTPGKACAPYLRNVASRNNDLCNGDIVIRNEYNLEEITNSRIVVHHIGDTVNQLDDKLGNVVSRGRLASKDDYTRLNAGLLGRRH